MLAKERIHPLDFAAMPGEGIAHCRKIGQLRRNFRRLRSHTAGPPIPGKVRIVVVDPEEPRPALWHVRKELPESRRDVVLRGAVQVVHPSVPGLQPVFLVERGPEGAGGGPVEMEPSAAHARVVVPGAEDLGQGHHVRRQRRTEPAHAYRYRRPPCHQRSARRYALRRRGERSIEAHAFGRKAIQVRRGQPTRAICPHIGGAMVVGENQQQVGRGVLALQKSGRRNARHQCSARNPHS